MQDLEFFIWIYLIIIEQYKDKCVELEFLTFPTKIDRNRTAFLVNQVYIYWIKYSSCIMVNNFVQQLEKSYVLHLFSDTIVYKV